MDHLLRDQLSLAKMVESVAQNHNKAINVRMFEEINILSSYAKYSLSSCGSVSAGLVVPERRIRHLPKQRQDKPEKSVYSYIIFFPRPSVQTHPPKFSRKTTVASRLNIQVCLVPLMYNGVVADLPGSHPSGYIGRHKGAVKYLTALWSGWDSIANRKRASVTDAVFSNKRPVRFRLIGCERERQVLGTQLWLRCGDGG
jgi:hypothetical protein